jgi:hypothetical protein
MNLFLKATLVVLACGLADASVRASCLEAWPPDMKTRPDFTCVPLTDGLLVSLQGATKADVTKAMRAIGRPLGKGEEDVLHFNSVADRYSGYMNFDIKDDRVMRIFGIVDSGENGPTLSFIWNPAYHGPLPNACSDLPGSHYARCNK